MRQQPAQDPQAWLAALYQQHADAVHGYARRRVDCDEDAEDVLVEVFTTAWRRRADVPEQALPWLYATAAHVIAHVVRGQARRRRLGARLAVVRPLGDSAADPADRVVAAQAARASVGRALEQLPTADAELLRLWAWEHLEPAEIADVLGIAPGTARTRLHRARTRMRELLAADGATGPWQEPPSDAADTAAGRAHGSEY